MSDLDLSVLVSRNALGLAPLEMNDGSIYKSADQLLGGSTTWNRTTAASPYVEGDETTHATRGNVQEPMSFEVWGRAAAAPTLSNATLQANMAAAIAAFNQASYTVTVTVDTAVYAYQCEEADCTVTWIGTRFMAKQGKLTFNVVRKPVPLLGGV